MCDYSISQILSYLSTQGRYSFYYRHAALTDPISVYLFIKYPEK